MEPAHLERLTAAECRRLLPGALVGRLVLPTPNFPTVEPVAFAPVDEGVAVVVRAGSAGDAAAPDTPVAFEADVLDHELRRGWSVVVKGALVPAGAELVEAVKAQVTPWPVAAGDRVLLVRTERITGRGLQITACVIDPDGAIAGWQDKGQIDLSEEGIRLTKAGLRATKELLLASLLATAEMNVSALTKPGLHEAFAAFLDGREMSWRALRA